MMLKLTRPDGGPVWIAPEAIVRVVASEGAEVIPAQSSRGSRIDLGGVTQYVREAAEDVVGLLEGRKPAWAERG